MGEVTINFREMTDIEYKSFYEKGIEDYSKDLITSGYCTEEEALDGAKKQFNEILPQGKLTKDSFIYTIVDGENREIGVIWYKKHPEDMVFICDFIINENHRNRGYGKQSLLLLEDVVNKKGVNKIVLHVFRFNKTAISLYEKVGYKIVKEDDKSIYMVKDITIL